MLINSAGVALGLLWRERHTRTGYGRFEAMLLIR